MSWNWPIFWPHSVRVFRVVDAAPVAFVDDAQCHQRDAEVVRRQSSRVGALAAMAAGVLLGLTEQPIGSQPHVVEEQFAGRRRHHAHLLERLALGQARHAGIEHERQHRSAATVDGATGAIVEFGVDEKDVGVGGVGDERLLPVEQVVLTVAPRGGLHPAEGIRARVGLGDRPGRDLVERHQFR